MSNKTFSVLQYSSVATALLAISNDINAQIIYEDVNPDLVYGDDILIDLDLDGNNDFRFTKSHFWDSTLGYDHCYTVDQFGVIPVGDGNAIVGVDPSYGSCWANRLDSGYLINSSAQFVSGQYLGITKKHREVDCDFASSIIEDWHFSSQSPAITEADLLLGFRLNIDNCYYHGWMRYAIIDSVEFISIKDYAFNTDCGHGIYAGKIKSDVSTLTATYSGNVISINIPDKMINSDISIYAITGQLIFNDKIENINTSISADIFLNGIYIIVVQNDKFRYVNKLSIY
ncbi:MAG: T9SS type A sorting domain-containing protein [Chitinophagales bacterium]|nr:T9SS type A sorting domain-containing protein [Bacteroidota bacterium]